MGWTELVVIAIVLLVFVGPKNLPAMLRKFTEVMGELRSATRELRGQIEEEIRDLESPAKMVRDLKREVMKEIPSPYEEARRVKEEVEGGLEQLKESLPDLKNPTAEAPEPKTPEPPPEKAGSDGDAK